MGFQKRTKRKEITYQDYLESYNDSFVINRNYHGWSYEDAEDFEVEQSGYTFFEYETNRMIAFVAMAYLEIQGDGLTDRLRGEIELDIPVWDSGEIDGILYEEEKIIVYEHLNVIKNYIKEHSN